MIPDSVGSVIVDAADNVDPFIRRRPVAVETDLPRYIPGSWKGTKENPKIGEIRYIQRYIPGFWKGNAETSNKPKYIPG